MQTGSKGTNSLLSLAGNSKKLFWTWRVTPEELELGDPCEVQEQGAEDAAHLAECLSSIHGARFSPRTTKN